MKLTGLFLIACVGLSLKDKRLDKLGVISGELHHRLAAALSRRRRASTSMAASC